MILIGGEPVGLLDEALVADARPGGGSLVLAVENAVTAAKYGARLQPVSEPKPRAPPVVIVIVRRTLVLVCIL